MKTVGIKDLKNNLSAYLRDVKRGTRILVSDRNSYMNGATILLDGGV